MKVRHIAPEIREALDLHPVFGQILPPREQRILEGFYFERRTFAELGEELDLTRERVRQLRSQALARLQAWLRPPPPRRPPEPRPRFARPPWSTSKRRGPLEYVTLTVRIVCLSDVDADYVRDELVYALRAIDRDMEIQLLPRDE